MTARAARAAGTPTELEVTDPRYIEVTDLVQRGDFVRAAVSIESLLEQGFYDIRMLGFYLYARFAEAGTTELGNVFSTLHVLLEQNRHALGPTRKLEQHVDKTVVWLCQKVLDNIEYQQGKKPEVWSQWLSRTTPDEIALASASVEKLLDLLRPPTYPHSDPLLSRSLRLLRDLHRTLLVEHAPPLEAAHELRAPTKLPPTARLPSVASPELPVQHMRLQVSPHFVELDRKLRAFSQLVAHGSYEKAALVSDDLLELIEHFDPRKYFPEFFAVFSRLMSEHVQDLETHWDKRDTIQWKALKQFYQVDLDAFSGNTRDRGTP
jgi:hypothetical protein